MVPPKPYMLEPTEDTTESREPEDTNRKPSFAGLLTRINEYKAGFYPLSARKLGQEGTVLVGVSLDARGNMTAVEIIEGCKHRALNRSAIRLMKKVMKEPFPHNLQKNVTLRIPIEYELD
jgi:TonB family protein